MIKRYSRAGISGMLREFPEGKYVLYSNHIAKVAELEAENKELKEMGTVKQRMRFCEKNEILQSKLNKAIKYFKLIKQPIQLIQLNKDDHEQLANFLVMRCHENMVYAKDALKELEVLND